MQKKTLDRYRQLFPDETLRETSARTGIQITRVFRLFNGKTMKVGELEVFEAQITKKLEENPSFSRLNSAIDEATTILTNDELAKLAEYVQRKVAARSFNRLYFKSNYESAIIA
jgi:glyceraldehyde-3-phosphate dehydrogenase/erythrose-4-phosphate dehydrogenase